MNRRSFLLSSAALLGGGILASRVFAQLPPEGSTAGVFEVTRTEEEWRALLTQEQFYVLRQAGTEYPWTSPLLDEHRVGTFNCAGCALPLYASETKYDSRTGWPSFWQEIPDAVRTSTDYLLGYPRTEVHCRRCGGHLGHIFTDGPQPTGLRHCINGVSLTFAAT
ncbi:MAG: peptide-methionine (R)-S-oxide reductase MsrB [Bauldia sp.]